MLGALYFHFSAMSFYARGILCRLFLPYVRLKMTIILLSAYRSSEHFFYSSRYFAQREKRRISSAFRSDFFSQVMNVIKKDQENSQHRYKGIFHKTKGKEKKKFYPKFNNIFSAKHNSHC